MGEICRIIRRDLLDAGVVDELIVCDTGSAYIAPLSPGGRMSSEVMQGMLRRFDELGRLKIPELPSEMLQFEGGDTRVHRVEVTEFPPLRQVSA